MTSHEHQSRYFGHGSQCRFALSCNQASGKNIRLFRRKHGPKLGPPGQVSWACFYRPSIYQKAYGISPLQLMLYQAFPHFLDHTLIPQSLSQHCKHRLKRAPIIQHGQEKIMLCRDIFISFGILYNPQRNFSFFNQRITVTGPIGSCTNIWRIDGGGIFFPDMDTQKFPLCREQNISLHSLWLKTRLSCEPMIQSIAV